jgi:hypothetical protein
MLQCIMYIFLSGATMLGSGCIPVDGHYVVDRVEYVNSNYAPSPYSYEPYTYEYRASFYPYSYWNYYNNRPYYRKNRRYTPAYKKWYKKRYRPHKRHVKTRKVYKAKPYKAILPKQKRFKHKKGKKGKWK